MIKNQKQASSVKNRLKELNEEKNSIQKLLSQSDEYKLKLSTRALDGVIDELEAEMSEYYGLINSNFHCLKAKNLNDIPKVLIGARLAQNISQKKLGDMVGLKEQLIQRYESNDYETASWPRIVEIATALGTDISFQKILILNLSTDFEIEGYTPEEIASANKQIREGGLLII